MSIVTGPTPIGGGKQVRIPLPTASIVARAVAVGNLTTAAVQVTVASSSRYLLPGSADLFPISSGQSFVTVLSLGTATQGGNITTTWFTPTEIPQAGYPYGAPVTAIAATGTVKITGPITVETAATKPLDIAGPVTITSGTVDATITSGTVDVGTVSGDITLTPTQKVNIGTIDAGTVDATVTGTVSLEATTVVGVTSFTPTVTVSPAAGDTFTVEGKTGGTAIGIAGSVDITSGTVDVGTVTGNVSVENVANSVLQTGDRQDFLLSTGKQTFGTSHTFSIPTTPATIFGCYAVIYRPTTATGPVPYCVAVSAAGRKGGLLSPGLARYRLVYVAPMGRNGTTRGTSDNTAPYGVWQAVVPASRGVTATSSTFGRYLTVWFSKAGKGSIAVYGLTGNPGVQLRPDGRAFPMGAFSTGTVFANNGIVAAIAAPTSPLRILLQSLVLRGATPTATGDAYGTIAGATTRRLLWATGKGIWVREPHGGVLLDPGTALELTSGSSHYVALSATYDLVV